MKECFFLQHYTDWSEASLAANSALMTHVRTCPACREMLASWRAAAPEIIAVDRETVGDGIADPLGVERLIRRAREHQSKESGFRKARLLPAMAALAAAVLLMVGAVLFRRPPEAPQTPSTAVLGSVSLISESGADVRVLDARHPELSVPEGGRGLARIGEDALGLTGGARVRIERAGNAETTVSLLRGTVSVQAAHRKPGERLIVTSGKVRVRVVGTRFSVARKTGAVTEVAVAEGRVEVTDAAGRRHVVVADQRLRLAPGDKADLSPLRDADRQLMDGLLAPPSTPPETRSALSSPPVDVTADGETETGTDAVSETLPAASKTVKRHDGALKQWRGWLVAGRVAEAETALSSYLTTHPGNVEAWSLLADCYRKTGNWQGALTALHKVETGSRSIEAARARFRAGVILQDRLHDHAAAAKKFSAYLRAERSPLAAEASVRLAISYLAMHRTQEARALLERVAREHGGTSAAERAQKMLLAL